MLAANSETWAKTEIHERGTSSKGEMKSKSKLNDCKKI